MAWSSTVGVVLTMLLIGESTLLYFASQQWCMLLTVPILWSVLALLFLLKNGSEHSELLLMLIAIFTMQSFLQFGLSNKLVVHNIGADALKYFGLFAVLVLSLLYLYLANPGNVADSMSPQLVGLAILLSVSIFVLVVFTEVVAYVAKPKGSSPVAIGLVHFLAALAGIALVVMIFLLIGKYIVGNLQLTPSNGFSIATMAKNLLTIVLLLAVLVVALKFLDGYLATNPFYRYFKAGYRLAACKAGAAGAPDKAGAKVLLLSTAACVLYIFFAVVVGPKASQWFYQRHATVVQNAPVSTAVETAIVPLKEETEGLEQEQNKKQDFSHSVSFWFYINSFALNTRKSYQEGADRLISFGGIPEVTYNAATNALTVALASRSSSARGTVYTHPDVQLQKWNNVVVNYSSANVLDVFYNGALVKSDVQLTVPYDFKDAIVIGSNRGVSGSVANVMTFETMQSAFNIDQLYQLYSTMSAPIV